METINNVATAAAKAVWGSDDTNREPISGATGDVSKGQPYDAGNLEAEDQKKVERTLSGDKKPETTGGPADESAPSKPSAVEATPAHGDTSHQQTDVRYPENPDEPEVVEPKGPGPKPVAIVAAEHGGDAGKRDVSTEDESSKPDDEGLSKENKGTGEQVVTATGFAAEGGDFDATKPGAAKEADRLLDQKGEGVSHNHDGSPKDTDDNGSSKDKKRLSERIKAKFHKH